MFVSVSGKHRVGLRSSRALDWRQERGGLVLVVFVFSVLSRIVFLRPNPAYCFSSNSDFPRRRR